MRRLLNWLALFALLIVIPPTLSAQHLKQTVRPTVDLKEIANLKQVSQLKHLEQLDNSYLAYFKFNQIPDHSLMEKMEKKGLRLLSYKDNRTYLVSFPKGLTESEAKELGILAFAATKKEHKLAPGIKEKDYPQHALLSENELKVAINFQPGFSKEAYKAVLAKHGGELLEDLYRSGTSMTAVINPAHIDAIAAEALVAFIDVATPPVEALNNEMRALQKVSYVNAALGKNLNGNGVTVGIGDGGELGDHLDFQDRVINYANGTYSAFGDHGDHVAGIIGGAGVINPRHRGAASEANLLIQKTSLITYYMEDYYNNDGMVLTNNSYGTSFNCTSNGSYNYTSQNLDWQMREFPEALHVFAAGNSGAETCAPYPTGFFTLLRYYQSAKNVLTVGNVTDAREIKSNSSRGPASDGRLKPEICGLGTSITSTARNYDYVIKSGTSMASPAVTGTLALLYESYKNQNSGANPPGGLVKAIACNTAEDLGNTGPDYTYGFGLINALRAVETIEEGRFVQDAIIDGASETHNITVPANTKQVKVMLYWQDKEASPYPTKALINNLDLVLTTSGGTNYLPWVLNHDPAHVNDLATRQVDDLNNIEQVTIDNPAAGSYTVTVSGTEVPFGPQDYFIVYEFITDDIVLTNPVGAEQLVPGDAEVIQWDTDVTNTSTFTVEYSLDGGSTWLMIDDNVAASDRSIFWTVPNNFTANGFVRVQKNTGSYNDSNDVSFSIFDLPELTVSPACEGRVLMEWPALNNADYYELYLFDGVEFQLADTTSSLEYVLYDSNLIAGNTHWLTMRAKSNNGASSKMATAKSCIPDMDVPCDWADDLVAQAISIPIKGRINTNSGFTTEEAIKVEIKNIGNNEVSGFDISYQINEGTVVTENYAGVLPAGEVLSYSFDQTADLSNIGTYAVNAWVYLENDIFIHNDSLVGTHISEQLANNPVSLSSGPVIFDFDLTNSYSYTDSELGLTELINWDFETISDGTLVAGSSNGLELLISETANVIANDYSNSALFTMNLESHNSADGLLLNFVYSNNNLLPLQAAVETTNKVYVRGSDMAPWLEAYSMDETEAGWHNVNGIDISTILNDGGQTLSASFQVRFEENGKGLLVDDFTLYQTGALPVELMAFTATKQHNDAFLKWQTASEKNNDYFEVQVATTVADATEGNFTSLGHVKGIGTSSEINNYAYIDETPNKYGYRYYRLKQMDFDGTYSYSPLRQLKFPATQPKIKIYPNPFAEYFIIDSEETTSGNLTGQLINNMGQLVGSFKIPESIEPWSFRYDLEKAGITPGNYFIRFEEDGIIKTLGVMKSDGK